ncbi:hypothetical protein [Mesorhizobium sp. ES1-1]|uniref:hypothetical protein n=1 Tax=Mesorhizobium sp. ES1-1 TaxID=2876629 RepID=UPI001CC9333C|nr:hypothetical protein [Mesorhizobium sp. ES1-1]MBZ9678888.1 hypothetical protein [Mesorhizobium sp. ES1-1]
MTDEVQYHFEDIHAAIASEDGNHVILQMKDASGNVVGVSMGSETIPALVATLMSASAAASIAGKKKTQMIVDAAKLTISVPQDQSRVLRVYLRPDAVPIAFRVDRKHLFHLASALVDAESGPQAGAGPKH